MGLHLFLSLAEKEKAVPKRKRRGSCAKKEKKLIAVPKEKALIFAMLWLCQNPAGLSGGFSFFAKF